MKSNWKLFLDSGSEKKARIVLKKISERLGLERDWEIEPYHKGGFTTFFDVEHHGERSEAIVDALDITERVTRSIQLSGGIRSSPTGFSSDCTIPGLSAISWTFLE